MTQKSDWPRVEAIEDETSGWSDAFETKKEVVIIDLTLIMTTKHDLSALICQVRAVMRQECKVWAPETVDDIRLTSSMKVRSKGNMVFLVVNLESLACNEYSSMMFIPVQKRITDRVQPAESICNIQLYGS